MACSVRAFFLSGLVAVTVCTLVPVETSAGIKLGYVFPQDSTFDSAGAFGLDGRYRIGERWSVGFDLLAIFYESDALPYRVYTIENERNTIGGLAILVTGAYFLTDEFYAGAGIGVFGTALDENPSLNITEIDRRNGVAGEFMVGWLYKSPNRQHWLPFVELKYLFQEGGSVTYQFDTGETRKFSRFNNLGLYVGLTF